MEVDDTMLHWIAARRPGVSIDALRSKVVKPDPGAHHAGGVHRIDLAAIVPMVATPGDPDHGIASDPKNGALVKDIGRVKLDIAYGGSCTAGKRDDVDMYARVMADAESSGKRVAEGVKFFIQFGSQDVEQYAKDKGYLELFRRTGVQVIKPGCGACIGCGPGVSDRGDQVTVSAINRNYKGRSGPGKLFLASPLTVAASAVTGEIVEYKDGMFGAKK
jgi:3-isopropylmalate/(R)-2-methylmalate dehydratase large subunit